MNPRADLSATTLTVRTEPVQQRSTERITNLLDAAAALIDQHGIDGLTTSDVATSSSSSVGVVYRYFPNIQSLLRALAARNLERFVASVHVAAGADGDWETAADAIIDAYATLARTEPGFRAVRFGEVIDERFIQPEVGTTTSISRRFTELLVNNYGFAASDAFEFEIEVVVEIGDALLHRAFQYEGDGDDRFIATLRDLVRDRLGAYAP